MTGVQTCALPIFCSSLFGGYQLPFFSRKPYRLKGVSNVSDVVESKVLFTNLTDLDWTVFALSEAGFGSVYELRAMDTPEFLNLVEFVEIRQKLTDHP